MSKAYAEKQKIKIPDSNMHMIFTGNPGTGKTMIARIIAKMLFDLEVIHENKTYTAVTKPYYNGWAGSLEIGVMDGDKEVGIGYLSGLTDEVKANYKDYIHRVIEVGAMQLTPDCALRHGKMLGWRPDKPWRECSIDQLRSL